MIFDKIDLLDKLVLPISVLEEHKLGARLIHQTLIAMQIGRAHV